MRTLLKLLPLPSGETGVASDGHEVGREGLHAAARIIDAFHSGEEKVSKGIAVLPSLAPGELIQAWLRPWAFRNKNKGGVSVIARR